MAAKKNVIKKEIKGALDFNKMTPLMATFAMNEDTGKKGRMLKGPGAIQVERNVFPADFEHDKFEIEASFVMTFNIKEK